MSLISIVVLPGLVAGLDAGYNLRGWLTQPVEGAGVVLDKEGIDVREPRIKIVQPEDTVSERSALSLRYFGGAGPLTEEGTWSERVQVLSVDCVTDSTDEADLFEDRIGEILNTLIRPFETTCLFVKGAGPDFFDELALIKTALVPGQRRYHLSSPYAWDSADLGDLLFQWPATELDAIRRWFISPAISIEGYVGADNLLGRLTSLRMESGDHTTLDAVLSVASRAFRLWQDYDGLYVFSSTGTAATR